MQTLQYPNIEAHKLPFVSDLQSTGKFYLQLLLSERELVTDVAENLKYHFPKDPKGLTIILQLEAQRVCDLTVCQPVAAKH